MSFLRSKISFFLYGIFLCSLYATLTLSRTKQSIRNARSLVHSSSFTLNKREDAERDGQYLLGIKRLRRLYCNVGIGFHIQVLPNGKITGVHNENKYSKYVWHFMMKIITKTLINVRNLSNSFYIDYILFLISTDWYYCSYSIST